MRNFRSSHRTAVLVVALAWTAGSQAWAQNSITGFGTVSLGANTTQTVTLTNLSGTPASFVFTYGVEFTKTTTPSCSGTPVSCSVQVEFAPTKAGLRTDGLLAKNGAGNLLGTASLYGIGQGAQAIFLPGTISTIAGTYEPGGAGGYGSNQINAPQGMAVDSQGKYVYFADSSNNVIRKMDAHTGAMTVYAGQYVTDGNGNPLGAYSGDGGRATSAGLNSPFAVALDSAGNLYIADYGNNVIRKVDPTGIITTVAGDYARGGTFYGDGGAATSAGINGPTGVALNSQGNLYIADQGNQSIREVTTDGIIHTFAGNGTSGYGGDGGAATAATLCYPGYVTVDSSGNVYITDYNNLVRKITTDGIIHSIAGTYIATGNPAFGGQGGYSGDGGQATSAELNNPTQVAIDAAGNVYVVDNGNNLVRRVDTSGIITTIVGNYADGYGYSGDGGVPTSAQLNFPIGIAVSPDGSIFVSDAGNNVIRAVSYSAPTMSFPATNIGSESPSQTTTIENIGDAALAFTGLTTGTNFVQTASGGTDCSASTNLAVDGSCEIAVAFEPEQGGSLTGNVTVTSGAFDIPLDGTANGPGVTLNPTGLAFGNQTISTTSTAKTVTLTNSGNQSLTISSISITGTNSGDFSQTNNCGSTVAASGNCTISVTFTPSATGSRSATLAISDNGAGSPQTVSLTGTGTGTAQISFSPTSWAFGNQLVSSSSTAESITVTNPGNATLTISAVTITGTNSGDFSQTNNCSSVAAGSGSCTIQVTFTPSATGSRSASISVTDSASGSPHSVALSGTGTAPQISFSPNSWNFGNQGINTSSTAESITVTNPGTATLTISSVAITGTNSGDFSQTNNCSTVAAGSGSCTIQVTFTPSATGSRSASISVTDNASGSPHTVSLSGTGTASQVSFSPSSWSFGNQLINTTSTVESITVTNSGTATLTISGVAITGTNSGDFSQANNCSTPLASGSGSCTIQVTFTPSATGSRSASISVTDSAAGSPHTVSLSGTGTAPQVSFSPTSWGFGNQLVNTSSTAQSITVTNPGTATLTISSVAMAGTNPGDFSETNNCSTLAAGSGSCTIQVTFTPSATGSRSAYISVTDSASGSPQTVSLSGTGVGNSQVSLSPATLTFASQSVGSTSAAQTITLSNPGTGALAVAAITVSGTNPGDFSETNTCGTSVAAGASCTISIIFTPLQGGTRSASISVTDTGAGSPQTVRLTGIGVGIGELPGDVRVIGDFDGDGKLDEGVWRPSTGMWYLVLSSTGSNVQQQWGLPGDIPMPGDYSGSGRTDYAVWRPSNGTWYILPTDQAASYSVQWGLPGDVPVTGDFDGDGKSDLAVWRPSNGTWYITPSSTGVSYARQWGVAGDVPVASDYDGDGKTDPAVWRASNGVWYILPSSTGQSYARQWGAPGDVPVPADYDRDGHTDLAVWRPSNGLWYIVPSSNASSTYVKQWGSPTNLLDAKFSVGSLGTGVYLRVAGDFDGDGQLDFAVWQPATGTWYVVPSGDPGVPITQQWGLSGDVPVSGDFNGDGKADFAVWRPSNGTWYVVPSGGATPYTQQFGLPGDIPAAGDYDGDGKTDFAVWRPASGAWYIIRSSTDLLYSTQWGLPGDVPVAADYDGLGKTDIAVWRPSNGIWYIVPSSGSPYSQQWGVLGDVPVPNDYDGLGRTDLAVWRPSNGIRYITPSEGLGP